MKCVKTKAGKVTRVEDHVAEAMVRSGDANLISKEEWKKIRGPVKEKTSKKEAKK